MKRYVQVLFVLLSFGFMVVTSYFFVNDIERKHLESEVENAFLEARNFINASLGESRIVLNGIAYTVRQKIMYGDSVEKIQEYLKGITDNVLLGEADQMPGFAGVYGYFEIFDGELLDGLTRKIPENYVPEERHWYIRASASNGKIIFVQPYPDASTGESVITLARSISDNEGRQLGVIALDITFDRIGKYIADTSLAEGGYGFMLDEELTVIAHPNSASLNKPLSELDSGIAVLADELAQGLEISERDVVCCFESQAVIFIRQFENGWYMGIVTPNYSYYRELRNMTRSLILLGIAMAVILSGILLFILSAKDKAENQTQIMFESMPLAANFWNKKNKNIRTNMEAVRLFEMSSKQEYLDRFHELSPEYQPDGELSSIKAIKLVNQAFKEGYCRFEWMHQKPNGELIPSEVTLVRVTYKNDYVVLGYTYDMRKLKELLRMEAANNAKSTFLATISHEIRTPLNAILGISEFQLQKTAGFPEMEKALGKIYDSGQLLLNIVNDILDLSKIEAGKLEFLPAKYNIPSLINDTAQLNYIRYENKPVTFKINIDENTPLNMFGDALRIKQILNNLLSNAFKYTDEGEVTLSVSGDFKEQIYSPETNPEERSEGILIIRVSDTGQGMTKEQIDRLFSEYNRFNLEANRNITGTGLGLNITDRLVQLMNGEIHVESVPGKGSVFTIRLPQERVGSAVCGTEFIKQLGKLDYQKLSKINKAQISREYMPYGSVLIVDDVTTNLYVARGMMLPYGLKIETAASGFDAIDKIKEGNVYDIIFMDHMMPKMNGIEALKNIRGLEYNHPIIALTAHAMTGQKEKLLNNGFDGFISKPIDSRELNAVLNKLIRDKQPPEVLAVVRQEKNASTQETDLNREIAAFFVRDAENAVTVLEEIMAKQNTANDADKDLYITITHGIKGALTYIGKTRLSGIASKLEQAGREWDTAVISSETPVFLKGLQTVIKEIKPDEEYSETGALENTAYLSDMLNEFKSACAIYNMKAAKAALDNLKQKKWPRSIKEALDNISVHLLHSAFEKASDAAGNITLSN